jgi:hypothetical protein
MVERTGHRFVAGAEPAEAVIRPIRERLPVAPPAEASMLANRDLFGHLATEAMLPRMERAIAEWAPDMVLREPCEYASAIVAADRGMRVAQIAISLADVEAGSIARAAPALEAQRSGLVAALQAAPYVTSFPQRLDPSGFADTIRYREPTSTNHGSLPGWWRDSEQPLVYLTFGTVLGHMSIALSVYRAALRAVGSLPVRVLLTVGHQFDRSQLDPPPNVHVERWVDQDHVFDQADLVVCHGGSGTTFGAVANGLPLVMVPLFADQFENAQRVAEAGLGVCVESDSNDDGGRRPIGDVDAARIEAAIAQVLAERSFRAKAQSLAEELQATPDVEEVLTALAM